MRLTSEQKILLGVLGITVAIITAAVFLMTRSAPIPARTDLIPSDAHTKGNLDAPVYLVEFSDFQCPACAAVKPLVDELVKNHEKDLLFAYRHYPLPQHPLAPKAAEAAEAAGAQGKFWEMYDLIFANSEKLTEPMLRDFAKQLGLDETKFAADVRTAPYTAPDTGGR